MPLERLSSSNGQSFHFPSFTTASIHQVFVGQVDQNPDAIAVILPTLQASSGDRKLTYQALHQKSDQLAFLLQQHGVQPGDIVAVAMTRSLEVVIALLGILKAGAGYLPLDLSYPPERLTFMLEDAQPRVLLTQTSQTGLFPQISCPVLTLDPDWGNDAAEPVAFQPVVTSLDSLAYINYTSGSTGQPKGVMIPHRGVLRLVLGNTYATFGPQTCFLQLAPLAFDAATFELWGALLNGGCCVLFPEQGLPEFQTLGHILSHYPVTTLWLTASLFNTLITEAPHILASVKEILTGGEALSPFYVRRAIAALPQTQLINGYGPTENTTFTCCYRIPADLDPDVTSIPIGSAIAQTELYVLDETLQPVVPGEPGELFVGGAGLALGYLNRPALTEERFIPNPFQPQTQDKLYKTGDRVRLRSNGQFEFLGRVDHQVKLRGYRIELPEIEQVLAQHPQVREALVMLRNDEPDSPYLAAYVITTDAGLDLADLKTYLQAHLPPYMVPTAFVQLETFPLTPNGKTDRQALPRPVRDESPALIPQPSFSSGDRTALETVIADVWCEVLRISSLDVNTALSDLGGTSLQALQIVHRLQQRLGIPVRTVQLYQAPTVRKLAALLHDSAQPVEQRETAVTPPSRSQTTDIAIIGMVGRFPGANSVEEFWQNLCAGVESITYFSEPALDPSIPRDRVHDPAYVRARGILEGAETFDAAFFEIHPREAEILDPQARVFLELTYEALEMVGYVADHYPGQIGLFAGSGQNTYFIRHLCGRSDLGAGIDDFQLMLANEKDFLTTRTSYKLNLKGPSVSINTACSTSLVAVIQAVESLIRQQCDLAIAGGVSISTPQNQGYLYQEGSIYSPDGHCRPFDAQAQGTVFSNGAGLVVLKRLEEAQRDRDRVYAIIKGYGLNNDGADKVSFTAPSIPGQIAALTAAHARAGFRPETISYLEAHGTATPIGDPMEVEALNQAFRQQTQARQFCAIGSLKGNVGHLVAAAGVAGLIKTTLALYHRQIPPSLNYQSANPEIDFPNSPFYVNTTLKPWEPPVQAGVRRAGVSALGIGGTNAHVLLEEAPPSDIPLPSSRSAHLLLWSAKTPLALQQMTQRLQEHLAQHPDLSLADVAYTLQVGRPTYAYRQSVIVRDRVDALEQLAALAIDAQEPRAYPTMTCRPLVFMFPGQGSQYLQMGQQLYESEPVFRQVIEDCAAILQSILALDLRDILYPNLQTETTQNTTSSLYQTPNTQIGLFVVEYALARLWKSWGIEPAAYIGHSIGEFVAACLAGVFSLPDALTIVAARGRLMADLPPGAMLAVSLPIQDLIAQLPPELAIAAVNSPTACVVSGSIPAIEAFQEQLQIQDIGFRRLHTGHAFHSPMMADCVAPLAAVLKTVSLHPPLVPLISTVTGTWMTESEATDPDYWAHHLVNPVQFGAGIQTLWQSSYQVLLEVGPRTTLTTLARQQIKVPQQQWAIASLAGVTTPDLEWRSLLNAITQLNQVGISPDWTLFYAHEQRQRIPLPTYPFQRQRYWIDPPLSATVTPTPLENSGVEILAIKTPGLETPDAALPPTPSSYPSPSPTMSIPSVQPTLNGSNGSRKLELLRSLKAIVQEISGFNDDQLDETVSFFELGLDSLSLTQLALALKKKLKLKITFRQLLEEYTTLQALASFAEQTLPIPPHNPSASPLREQPRPTTPVQRAQPSTEPSIPQFPNPQAEITTSPPSESQTVEQIIQQQLTLMARQLELLGKQPRTPDQPEQGGATAVTSSSLLDSTTTTGAPPIPTPLSAPLEATPAVTVAPRTRIDRQSGTALTPEQQAYLDRWIEQYTTKTAQSKHYAQTHRAYFADPRTVSGFTPQFKEMVYPIVTERSAGARLWDVDGNEYIDLVNGFGLNFFGWSSAFITDAIQEQLQQGFEIGPQTPLAGEVAQRISRMTGHERVVFCNTGSEAVMASLRLARTVTGRSLVALFSGAYHGTFDEVVIRGNSAGQGMPGAPGILPEMTENVLVLDYGTSESLETLRNRADDLAAILVEPVQSRRPELQPREFLQDLRHLTQQSETALIFDEVVTGFRVHPGGTQAYFGIQADLATYGKIIGGGLPIGVLAGHSTYMDALDGGFWQYGDASIPEVGVTFFAGTFVRHPLAIAAANAVLKHLEAGGPDLQRSLNDKVEYLVRDLQAYIASVQAPLQIHHFSSFFYVSYPAEVPYGGLLFYLLRGKGIHIWEHRPCFLTLAHTDADIRQIAEAFKQSIAELQAAGFLSGASDSASNALPRSPDIFKLAHPPHPLARLGRDLNGNPSWYIPDEQRPGQYLQLHSFSSN